MKEATLTAAIIRWLKSEKLWHMKIHGSQWQRAGIPDLLVVVDGWAVFLEVKAPKGIVSPLQEETLKRLRAAKAVAVVVRSLEEAQAAVRSAAIQPC